MYHNSKTINSPASNFENILVYNWLPADSQTASGYISEYVPLDYFFFHAEKTIVDILLDIKQISALVEDEVVSFNGLIYRCSAS